MAPITVCVVFFGFAYGGSLSYHSATFHHVLNGYRYQAGVLDNYEQCYRWCQYEKRCKSINWFLETKVCELNDQVAATTIAFSRGVLHVSVQETVVNNACGTTSCDHDHTCIPVTSSQSYICGDSRPSETQASTTTLTTSSTISPTTSSTSPATSPTLTLLLYSTTTTTTTPTTTTISTSSATSTTTTISTTTTATTTTTTTTTTTATTTTASSTTTTSMTSTTTTSTTTSATTSTTTTTTTTSTTTTSATTTTSTTTSATTSTTTTTTTTTTSTTTSATTTTSTTTSATTTTTTTTTTSTTTTTPYDCEEFILMAGHYIAYNDPKELRDATPESCKAFCLAEKDFDCRSFDYSASMGRCWFTSVVKDDVLDMWRDDVNYDYYQRLDVTHPLGDQFEVVQEHLIAQNNQATDSTVLTVDQCKNLCLVAKDFVCRSFDFFEDTTTCYLANVTKDDVPNDFVYNNGYVYYERLTVCDKSVLP